MRAQRQALSLLLAGALALGAPPALAAAAIPEADPSRPGHRPPGPLPVDPVPPRPAQGRGSDLDGHPLREAVEAMMRVQVLAGYPDGSFRPDAPITRAEFAVLLDRAWWLPEAPGAGLAGVPAWAAGAVQRAAAAGLLHGTGPGRLDPERPVTREEAAAMVVRAINREQGLTWVADRVPLVQPDGSRLSPWARPAVGLALERGLLPWAGALQPQAPVTRAEAAALVQRARAEFPLVAVVAVPGTADLENAPALAAQVERLRAANPGGVILVHTGGALKGSLLVDVFQGEPAVAAMNAAGYDAATPAAGDLLQPADALRRRLQESGFPWVLAAPPRTDLGFRPHALVERHGVRVALVDPAGAVEAAGLRRQGASAVVAFGPGAVAAAPSLRGVDAAVGGGGSPSVTADGAPAVPAGEGPGGYGLVCLVVDSRTGAVVNRYGTSRRAAAGLRPLITVQAAILKYRQALQPLLAEEVATLPAGLDRKALGGLVAGALRRATGADLALADPALVRGALPPGAVTRGALLQALAADGPVYTFRLTGARLQELLQERPDLVPAGLQAGADGALTLEGGAPLELDTTYTVAAAGLEPPAGAAGARREERPVTEMAAAALQGR